MKNKYLVILIIAFIVFLGITVNYYLTHDYQIELIEKNNITRTARQRDLFETLLPVGYLEFDAGVEHWGYIDLDGEVAISLSYDKTYAFDENYLAVVKNNKKFGLINTIEENILTISYQTITYMGNQIYYYQDNASGHLGRYDVEKKQMILLKDVTYDEVGYFTDTLAYVIKDNKLGYISQTGDVNINLSYDVYPDFNFNFYSGYAFIYQNGKFGIINNDNVVVLTPQIDEVLNDYTFEFDYKNLYYEDYEMVPYRQGNLWGYMKRDGTVLTELVYLEAYPFTDNHLARVKLQTGYYNYIHEDGSSLSTAQYVNANDFYQGYAMTSFGKTKKGLINSLGNTVVSYIYDYIGTVNQQMILTITNGESKYLHIINEQEFITIDYYLGDDMTDCKVVFASNESGENKSYVILDQTGQRIYTKISPKSYTQFEHKDAQYIRLVAYEKASNLEYVTYINENGELLWKVYK